MTPTNAPQPAPRPDPAAAGEKIKAHGEAEKWRFLREKYTDMQTVEKLFGEPGGLARDAFVRLIDNNEGHSQHREEVKRMVRDLADKMFNAFKKYVEGRSMITTSTEDALADVYNKFYKYIGIMGDQYKMHETTYSDDTKREILDTRELLQLEGFLNNMLQLPIEDMVDMIYDLQDPGEVDEDGNQIRDNNNFLGMLSDRDSIDPNSRHYSNNIEVLMRFALGEIPDYDEKGELKEKSKFREYTEAVLAGEIIRKLNYQQKRDLIVKMLRVGGDSEKESVEITRKFIAESIAGGTISRREALHIYEEAEDPRAIEEDRKLIALLSDKDYDYQKMTLSAVEVKEHLKSGLAEAAKLVDDGPQIQNAAVYFFTLNNFAAETVGRVGLLTAVMNTVLKVTDKVKKRGEQNLAVAVAYGLADAAKSPKVIGGLAVSAVCSEIIYPWMKDFAYAPSEEEQDRIDKSREERYLRDQADNHSELFDYYVSIYPRLIAKAGENERVKKEESELDFVAEEDEKRAFGIDLDDMKKIVKEANEAGEGDFSAGKFGFPNEGLAMATMIRMFGITARVLDKRTQSDLEYYLIDNNLWGVADEEVFAKTL